MDRLTWGIADSVARNDFEPALVNAADATVAEPATGTAFAEVPVSLSGPNGFLSVDAPLAGRRGQPVTVNYPTADGTATAGQDYTPLPAPLPSIRPTRVTTLSVMIPILLDTVTDDGETVLLRLSAAVNGIIQRATATLTITDTTPASPVVVRPGALHGWAVNFTTNSVRPGFVTGPADVRSVRVRSGSTPAARGLRRLGPRWSSATAGSTTSRSRT